MIAKLLAHLPGPAGRGPVCSQFQLPRLRCIIASRMVSRQPFDPLKSLQSASTRADLSAVNLRALTPFQRALMVIDGTVTKFIETYTMEPVEIVRLAQSRRTLTEAHPWLETPCNTTVAIREVLIQGKYADTFYGYAMSLIVLGRLDERVWERLQSDGSGIGRILDEMRMETRREILWYGREHLTDLPETLGHRTDGEFVSRTYRIINRKHPIALIHEKFPAVLDRLPSHH